MQPVLNLDDGRTRQCMDPLTRGEIDALIYNRAVKALNSEGMTPILIAAQNGHIDVFNALLEKNDNINLARETDGSTPLCLAAEYGHVDIVNLLLEKGTNVNCQRTSDGSTPLFRAAFNGSLPLVQALLNAGADVNLAANDGRTPLLTAVLCSDFEVIKTLYARPQTVASVIPTTIPTAHGYDTFIRHLLSTLSVLDYYLNQMILYPQLMRERLRSNSTFYKALYEHRDALWERLSGTDWFNLTEEAHESLLRDILRSTLPTGANHIHPIRDLFSQPELPQYARGCFASPFEGVTLVDVLAYVRENYAHPPVFFGP